MTSLTSFGLSSHGQTICHPGLDPGSQKSRISISHNEAIELGVPALCCAPAGMTSAARACASFRTGWRDGVWSLRRNFDRRFRRRFRFGFRAGTRAGSASGESEQPGQGEPDQHDRGDHDLGHRSRDDSEARADTGAHRAVEVGAAEQVAGDRADEGAEDQAR